MVPSRTRLRRSGSAAAKLVFALSGFGAGGYFAAAFVFSPLSTGCIDIGPRVTDAGPTSVSDAGTVSAEDGGPSGAGCAQDPITKVTLCTAVSACPEIQVDHDLFPNCGFRIRRDGFVLECWCNGYVCPMGTPSNCQQVSDLLSQQTEIGVCTQVEEGRCVGSAPDAGPTGSTVPIGCDRECMKNCGGSEDCQRFCGCK